MAVKGERLEARLTSTERQQIEQAAALAGESVSSLLSLLRLMPGGRVVLAGKSARRTDD